MLPELPEPHAEGGPPQSSIAPGDTGRELVHEVRNLATSVSLLHHVVGKQRRRQRSVLISVVISLLMLALALGYSRYLAVEQLRDRLAASNAACEDSNVRTDIEVDVLRKAVEGAPPSSPTAIFIEEQTQELLALRQDCDDRFPTPGSKEWPRYLDFP